MVAGPEYPDGFPLFTYETPERVATVCLFHPDDGSPPPPLATLREGVAAEIRALQESGQPANPFLDQYLAALDRLIAQRQGRQTTSSA